MVRKYIIHNVFRYQVYEHIARLQELVDTLSKLGVDEHEYAYLKSLVLFSVDHVAPGSLSVTERSLVLLGQRKATVELRQYLQQQHDNNIDRLSQLLLTLLTVRTLQPQVIRRFLCIVSSYLLLMHPKHVLCIFVLI